MAMENDVARIRAALNTPGLKYRSFGNQPVRGEAEPPTGSGVDARPVDAYPGEVDAQPAAAPAAMEGEDPNEVTQKIDWAALAAIAAEPEPEPTSTAPQQAPPVRAEAPPVAAPSPVNAPQLASPPAPVPLPTPTSQLLNLGAAPPKAAPPPTRNPDVAYALLDALTLPGPPTSSPPTTPQAGRPPTAGGTLALLRGAAMMAEAKPAEAPPAPAAPIPAAEVPTPLADIMQMIAAGIAAAGAKHAATPPSSES